MLGILIDGIAVEYVRTFKYLGVTLYCKLNFQQHFRNNERRFMGNLSKLRAFINTKTAVLVYKSHVLSFLEYGSIFLTSLSDYFF